MREAEHIISIHEDGTIEALYDDETAPLLHEVVEPGSLRIRRASDVEPMENGQGWTVYVRSWLPCGDVFLGPGGVGDRTPFPTRAAALEAEVRYLQEHAL